VSCFPEAGYQKLILGADSVTLNCDSFVFAAGDGETWLDLFGCDRQPDPEYLAKTFFGYGGASHWKSYPFNAPFRYRWKLQLLSEATYFGLRALARRSRNTRTPIRLLDYLIPLDEDAPRIRGAVGVELPSPFPSVKWFYPQFNVELTVGEGVPREYGYDVEMSAIEYDPDRPVTGDVAA
jgi:hypothetical protein